MKMFRGARPGQVPRLARVGTIRSILCIAQEGAPRVRAESRPRFGRGPGDLAGPGE
jgi:hypothetical protein